MTEDFDRVAEARRFFDVVVTITNQFLMHAKRFEIHILQDFDPSYEEIAKRIEELVVFINLVMLDIDPHLASQANDFAYLMGQLALAIRKGDEDLMNEIVATLDKKSFIV